MFKEIIATLGMVAFVTHSHAAPITITQTYSNVSYSDYEQISSIAYGAHPSDDWVFKGTVDSDASNLSDSAQFGAYKLSQLTLTQASLGLFDVPIKNSPILFFYTDRFGFANTISGTSPWTVVVYEANHFSSANTLESYLSLATTPSVTDDYTSFGPQWDGFELEDGRRLYGWGVGPASIAVSSVPEPGSLTLHLLGAGLLVGCSLRASKGRRTHSH